MRYVEVVVSDHISKSGTSLHCAYIYMALMREDAR